MVENTEEKFSGDYKLLVMEGQCAYHIVQLVRSAVC